MGNAVDLVLNDRAGHAESPVWSAAEGALYWVDTTPGTIYRLDVASGERASWPTPARLGAIGLRGANGLIVAIKSGIGFLDTATGRFDPVVDPEASEPDTRINDAKVDRAGRLWFGSLEDAATAPRGKLYRIDPDLTVSVHDRGYTIPNGFAWSPDGRRMYVTDTAIRTIWLYDYDPESGRPSNRRPFVRDPAWGGRPDGTTVDAAGNVWTAWGGGGGRLVRFAPDGSVDTTVALPTTHVTNMTLGGADMRTLYITTASRGLTEEQLAVQPFAGGILCARTDVPGIPEPNFGG